MQFWSLSHKLLLCLFFCSGFFCGPKLHWSGSLQKFEYHWPITLLLQRPLTKVCKCWCRTKRPPFSACEIRSRRPQAPWEDYKKHKKSPKTKNNQKTTKQNDLKEPKRTSEKRGRRKRCNVRRLFFLFFLLLIEGQKSDGVVHWLEEKQSNLWEGGGFVIHSDSKDQIPRGRWSRIGFFLAQLFLSFLPFLPSFLPSSSSSSFLLFLLLLLLPSSSSFFLPLFFPFPSFLLLSITL